MITIPPIVVGLFLADSLLVDPGNEDPSLFGLFRGKEFPSFPTPPVEMIAFFMSTGGRGDGILELTVYPLGENGDHDPNNWIYRKRKRCGFPTDDPNRVVNVALPTKSLRFHEPGDYLFVLTLEGQPVAERRLLVRLEN
jgi:hypothetical protein